MLQKYFPTFGIKNLQIYYWITLLGNSWFVMPNWFFYWLKFMSPTELGIQESIVFLVGFIIEIPSGALSDLIGKKRTIFLGHFLFAIGTIVWIIASDKYMLLVGTIIYFVGWAFRSGAEEALAYDSMLENRKEKDYPLVASRAGILAMIMTLISAFVGGWMYSVDEKLPIYGMALAFVFTTILTLFLKEPAVDTYDFSISQYKSQLVKGFGRLFNRRLLKFTTLLFISIGIFDMYADGFIRLHMAQYFGYNGETAGYLIGVSYIVASAGLIYFNEIRKYLGDSRGIQLFTLAIGLTFLGTALLSSGQVMGLIIFILLSFFGKTLRVWMTVIVNENTISNMRATVISTMQLLLKIPYILVAPFAGLLIENNVGSVFYLGIGAVLLITLLLSNFLLQSSEEE